MWITSNPFAHYLSGLFFFPYEYTLVVVNTNKLWTFLKYNDSIFEFWYLFLNISKRKWNLTNAVTFLRN